MKSYNNLPPEQHSVQRLVDQFNADERRWQDLRREILKALRNIKKIRRKTPHPPRPERGLAEKG